MEMELILFISFTLLTPSALSTVDLGKNQNVSSEVSPVIVLLPHEAHVIPKPSTPHIEPHQAPKPSTPHIESHQAPKPSTTLIEPQQSTKLFAEGGTNNMNDEDKNKLDTPPEKKLPPSIETEFGNTSSIIGKPRKRILVYPTTEVPKLSISDPKVNVSPDPPVTKNSVTTEKTKVIEKNITTTTEVAKKPLILSGDDLEASIVPDNHTQDRIESSKKLSKPSIVNAHPNLVIPVTITVFALPLFAVLGYYALKHGREAWKNRHYRRMDFLLDGMYND